MLNTYCHNHLKFAANLDCLFTEFTFLDRFKQAKLAGFNGVECLRPYNEEVKLIKQALIDNQLKMILINAPSGNENERGTASLINRDTDFKASIKLAQLYASTLSCSKIHVLSGNRDSNVPFEDQYQQLIKNMRFAADYFKTYNITLLIEPLNPFDMPSYLINNLEMADKVITDINRCNVALQFDMFHCQRMQGNILYYFEKYQSIISHIQIASSPYRNEPDRGEINYAWLFSQIEKMNYCQWIGCEYQPENTTLAGLGWFVERKK